MVFNLYLKRIGTTCSTDFAACIVYGAWETARRYIFHYSYFPDFIFLGRGGGPRLLFFIGPRIWRARLYEIEIRTDFIADPP